MTTQFFELQDSARGQTTRLIVLFTIAVAIVVGLMSALGFFIGGAFSGDSIERLGVAFPVYLGLLFAVLTMLIITIGTLYQVSLLRQGGGAGVAESLGGRQSRPAHRCRQYSYWRSPGSTPLPRVISRAMRSLGSLEAPSKT